MVKEDQPHSAHSGSVLLLFFCTFWYEKTMKATVVRTVRSSLSLFFVTMTGNGRHHLQSCHGPSRPQGRRWQVGLGWRRSLYWGLQLPAVLHSSRPLWKVAGLHRKTSTVGPKELGRRLGVGLQSLQDLQLGHRRPPKSGRQGGQRGDQCTMSISFPHLLTYLIQKV